MEYWEYICYMDQTPGARKNILQHSPGNNSRRILYSEHSPQRRILSGSPEMLDYCIDHYDIDNMGLAYTEKRGTGSGHRRCRRRADGIYDRALSGINRACRSRAGDESRKHPNAASSLAEHPEHLNWYAALFFNLRDIRTPYMSAPGFPRNADTDVEMYRAFLEWESPEFSMDFILGQMRAELEKPTSRELDLKYYGEQEIQKTYNVNGLFSKNGA